MTWTERKFLSKYFLDFVFACLPLAHSHLLPKCKNGCFSWYKKRGLEDRNGERLDNIKTAQW